MPESANRDCPFSEPDSHIIRPGCAKLRLIAKRREGAAVRLENLESFPTQPRIPKRWARSCPTTLQESSTTLRPVRCSKTSNHKKTITFQIIHKNGFSQNKGTNGRAATRDFSSRAASSWKIQPCEASQSLQRQDSLGADWRSDLGGPLSRTHNSLLMGESRSR